MQLIGASRRLTGRSVRSDQQSGRHPMRVYALLLAVVLTSGYGYAAQIAVSSLGPGRQPATEPAGAIPASGALAGVWYGGVLGPVTGESRSDGARAAATQGGVLSRPTVRCADTHSSRFDAVS